MPSELTRFLHRIAVKASGHKLTQKARVRIVGAKDLIRDISGVPYLVTLLSRASDANHKAIVFSENVCVPVTKGHQSKVRENEPAAEEHKPVLRPEWLAIIKKIESGTIEDFVPYPKQAADQTFAAWSYRDNDHEYMISVDFKNKKAKNLNIYTAARSAGDYGYLRFTDFDSKLVKSSYPKLESGAQKLLDSYLKR